MASRPYRSLRIDQLEQLFAKAGENESHLHAILGELNHRSTVRALDLKQRLEKHLKTVLRSPPMDLRQPGRYRNPRKASGEEPFLGTKQSRRPPRVKRKCCQPRPRRRHYTSHAPNLNREKSRRMKP